MADDSLDPNDRAQMNELSKKLGDVLPELKGMRAEAERATKQTAQQTARMESAAAKESKARKASRPAGAAAAAETPGEARDVARDTERAADAEERKARAAEAHQRQLKEQLRVARQSQQIRFTGEREVPGIGGGPPPRRPRPTATGGFDENDPERFNRLRRALRPSLTELLGNQRVADAPARPNVQDAAQRIKTMQADNLLAGSTLHSAQAQRELEHSLQGSYRALGNSSDALRRHGALTTEFITAAAKGQVGIRELGFQVGATIGKFAGWTAAATAVYGAAAAFNELGQGAVSSLEGVNQIQRIIPNLDTEEAQQKFRDLAQEFNMPVDQVATAQYEMSRIFRDQGDSATAAQVALRAMSVAELDAGSSTRYLSAIVKGFQLDAEDLPLVLDQINEATNKFGGNTAQLVEGVSKAGGQFRAAGGDVQYLISLIEAGTSLTGRTGSEIGTAIQRSAEILQRPERRNQIIDLLGIDPKDSSIEEVYERAFERARGATGAQVTQIATALSTPQLATRITPILQNRPLFEDINKAIAPENAAGSAVDENTRRLKGFREQLGAILVDLQRFGSALAQSGALDPLAGVVTSADKLLDVMTKALEIINNIPRPLRTAGFLIAEMAVGMALLRRFNTGSIVSDRFPILKQSLSRDPEKLARAEVFRGLGDEKTYAQDRLAATSRERTESERRAVRQGARVRALQAGLGDEEEIAKAQNRLNELTEQTRIAKEEQLDAQRRYATVVRQDRGIRADLRDGRSIDQATRNNQVFWAGDLDNPTAAPEKRPGGTTVIPSAMFGLGDPSREMTRNQGMLREAAEDSRRWVTRMGVESQRTATVFSRSAAPILAGGRGLKAFASGARNLGSQIVGSLGPIDGALIALAALYAAYDSVQRDAEEAASSLTSITGGHAGPNVAIADAERGLSRGRNALDKIRDGWSNWFEFLTQPVFGDRATPNQVEDQGAEAAKRESEAIIKANASGVGLTGNQIRENLDARLKKAKTTEERQKALDQAQFELERGYNKLFGLGDAAEARTEANTSNYVKSVQARVDIVEHGLHAALAKVTDAAGLETFSGNLQTRIGLYGLNRQRERSAGEGIVRARELLAQTPASDTESTEKYLQEIEALEQSIIAPAEERLRRALAVARTPAEEQAARDAYLGSMSNALGIPQQERQIRVLTDRIARRGREIQDARTRLEASITAGQASRLAPAQPVDPLTPTLPGGLSDDIATTRANEAAMRGALSILQEQQKADRRALGELTQGLGESFGSLLTDQVEQEKAQLQRELASFDAGTELKVSRTADPVAQARVTAARLHERTQRVRDAYNNHRASRDELSQAIARENQSLQQLAQAELGQFRAQQGVGASARALSTRDPIALARGGVSDAQALLNRVRSMGDRLDPTEELSAVQALNDARKNLADAVRAEAEAMLNAQEAYELSGTNDPLAQARIRAEYASRRVREQPAESAAGRLQQRADARRARDDARQAGYQSKYDDISFEHDMGRITDAVYSQQLRDLAGTVRNNKDLKRRLLLEAKRLEDEMKGDQLSLNLGDIRLPTTYEIRSAMRGGLRQGNTVYVNNNPKVDVHVANDADVEKVGSALDKTLQTSTRAAMRSAGVIR